MSDAGSTDIMSYADVTVYAVRKEGDRRYWSCFVIGFGMTYTYWSAVIDDFGNLVEVA